MGEQGGERQLCDRDMLTPCKTTSVKDFGVFVLLEFGRFVLVRPDDLRPEWRFQDKTTGLARPKRDLVKTGMTVQVRLKYVDNPKKDPNDNYYGSMIASK